MEDKDTLEPYVPVVGDVQADPMTAVDNYDPKVKARAYELYLNTALTPQDIALDLGIHPKVVVRWIRKCQWDIRKQEIENQLQKEVDDLHRKRRRFIMEKQLPVAERHLRISEALETAIEDTINANKAGGGTIPDMVLKRLAEALSSVTGVSARVVGLDQPTNQLLEPTQQGKQPLIVLNVGLPQLPAEKIIPAEEVTVTRTPSPSLPVAPE